MAVDVITCLLTFEIFRFADDQISIDNRKESVASAFSPMFAEHVDL